MKITPSGSKEYYVDDSKKRKMLSISIDCTDCNTSVTSTQSSEASCELSANLPSTPCKGKMYILAAFESGKRVQYFLYVIDMDGTIHHLEQLGFLENDQLLDATISCIRQEKLIILDITSTCIYICDNKGKYLKTIDLGSAYFRKSTIFTISHNGDIVCSEGRTKLAIYNIEEDDSSVRKANELIELKYTVQAVAFNHESDELIILCHTLFKQYHLVIFTKAGELKQDIKLQNGDYRDAKLIYHRNGPVVLLDNEKLLHLK